MDGLLIIIVLVVVVVVVAAAAWYLYQQRQRAATPVPATSSVSAKGDIRRLNPGDAIGFWDGNDDVIRGVMTCREQVGERTTEWQWIFLNKGGLIEVLPRGQNMYEQGEVFLQGDDNFDALVGAGGALKRFEGNIREGIANEPVLVELSGATYRVRSTGTFVGTLRGQSPESSSIFDDTTPNAGDNVYFKLTPESREPGDTSVSDGEKWALGVWTTHIAVIPGRTLESHEITGIYPSNAPPGQR